MTKNYRISRGCFEKSYFNCMVETGLKPNLSLLPSKGVEFAPLKLGLFSCSPAQDIPMNFERNQFFTTFLGSIEFFCLAISGLLIVSNSVQFKTDYLAYLSPIYPGSKVPKRVFSIQYSVFFAIVTLFMVINCK